MKKICKNYYIIKIIFFCEDEFLKICLYFIYKNKKIMKHYKRYTNNYRDKMKKNYIFD